MATPGKPAPSTAKVTATAGGAPARPQATQTAQRAPSFTIRPMGDRERYLKLLVYGNYGVGKTHLAATASQVESMRDVLLINAEAGDLTVQEFSHLDEVTITNYYTLARVYEFLKAHCLARDTGDEDRLIELQEKVFQQEVEDEPRRYRSVIIDSLSEVEQYCMNQLLGNTDTTKLDEDPQAAEFKEYKQNHTMILRLVRNFRNLPMNVIFTCAEQFVQDETKRRLFTLDLTGKLSKKVQGFMDMVGYYVVSTNQEGQSARRLYVTPSQTAKYDAKHRYAKFKGNHFDNPTVGSILQATGLANKEGAQLKP